MHTQGMPIEAPSFAAPAPPADGRTNVPNAADPTASPFGWNDTNGAAGAESTLTVGNNVRAYTDVDDNNLPDPDSSPDGGAELEFDFPLDLTQPPSAYQPAAVSNLYFTNNRIHDILYRYGFDEFAGNFQVNNYGKGGLGNDAVNAEAQDGNGFNNANFGTPPDGRPPRMQMFIWDDPTPDLDGDLDNGIIVHEYGHGVSNRLTGGPVAAGCLGNQEQGGEGWSDFLAYMLTMPTGTEPAAGRGIGTYALNEPTTGPGIRQYRYSTSMVTNQHTYDSIKTVAVPHGVGSVWAEMLWELTYALIDEHGFDADLIAGDSGNNMALQLVMDGMKLQPCSPGFVDARDAILAADQANYAGENECLIWTAFAKRGLGYSATQGSSTSRADGTEAFDVSPVCDGLRLTRTTTPDPVQVGGQLTYGFQLENTSDDPGGLVGVTASGHVGDHATYVAGSATCGGTYDSGTEVVTFPVGAMAQGATLDCGFKVQVDASPFSVTRFADDFEPDLSAWTTSHGVGSADWSLATTVPHSPTHGAFATDPAVVSDQYLTLATPVAVAAGDQLSFWHSRGLEAGSSPLAYDGGVVEVSTNGTTWTDIGAASFVENGYSHTISANVSYQSPIIGRPAFSGSSGYIQSVANLGAYVGQSIRVRFRMASDNEVGEGGWAVDDVRIGTTVETTSTGTAVATGLQPQTVDVTSMIVDVPPTPPVVPPVVPPAATAPGQPKITSAKAKKKKTKIKFTLVSDGGSPVTSYKASCKSKNGGKKRGAKSTRSPITIKKLTPGKKYKCRVRAINAVGAGTWSKPKKVTVPKAKPKSREAVVPRFVNLRW